MPGAVPPRILSTPPPSAPPSPQPLSAVGMSRFAASGDKKAGPLDFSKISRYGSLKGIRNTHHFQRGLYRQIKAILPGDANYKLREEVTNIIANQITSSGRVYRKSLRDTLRDTSMPLTVKRRLFDKLGLKRM